MTLKNKFRPRKRRGEILAARTHLLIFTPPSLSGLPVNPKPENDMKPTPEQMEAYKEMAKASPDSMKAMIEQNLKATCDKYAGHEDKLDDCIDYLTDCAEEILGGKNGEVDNETCFRICRDYFNDEIWKKEEEEKAEQAAKAEKRKADQKKREEARAAKKKAAEEKRAAAAARKAELLAKKKAEAEAKKQAELLAKKKAEEEAKKAELEMMKAEAEREAKADEERKKAEEARKADLCPGQMDFFAIMGV